MIEKIFLDQNAFFFKSEAIVPMTHRVNHLIIRKLPAMYSYPFIFHLHRLYDLNKAFYRDGEADLVLE